MTNPIPPEVLALIESAIPSVAVMEALLLLRENPDTTWTVASLAERLYIKEAEARSCADLLMSQGLVESAEGGWRYAPRSDELRSAVEMLAECYRTRLIPLTRAIHERAPQQGIRLFADVFRLRKDP